MSANKRSKNALVDRERLLVFLLHHLVHTLDVDPTTSDTETYHAAVDALTTRLADISSEHPATKHTLALLRHVISWWWNNGNTADVFMKRRKTHATPSFRVLARFYFRNFSHTGTEGMAAIFTECSWLQMMGQVDFSCNARRTTMQRFHNWGNFISLRCIPIIPISVLSRHSHHSISS